MFDFSKVVERNRAALALRRRFGTARARAEHEARERAERERAESEAAAAASPGAPGDTEPPPSSDAGDDAGAADGVAGA